MGGGGGGGGGGRRGGHKGAGGVCIGEVGGGKSVHYGDGGCVFGGGGWVDVLSEADRERAACLSLGIECVLYRYNVFFRCRMCSLLTSGYRMCPL